MSTNQEIVLTHPKILEFYQNHPHLDPNQIHLSILHLYDSFQQNDQEEMTTKNTTQDILGQIHSIRSVLQSNESNVLSKFYELKSSYQEDLKYILENQTNQNLLKIMEKIEHENKELLEKTASKEYNHLISNIQTTILNYISNTEDRIRNHIHDIRVQQNDQEKVHQEILGFLNLYKTPTKKGEISENMLYVTLSQLFPSAEIVHTAKQTSSGDCIMKRNDRDTILFENKNYTTNVPKHEIDKFLYDVEQQNCSGIFMSQKTGISTKNNFEINLHKDHVLVYIHQMNYDQEKIAIAVDIIDQITNYMKLHANSTHAISKETIQLLGIQYQTFLEKRDRIITSLNENTKKMIQEIKDLSLSNVSLILSGFPQENPPTPESYTCTICNKYSTNTRRSLSGHIAICKKKNNETSPS